MYDERKAVFSAKWNYARRTRPLRANETRKVRRMVRGRRKGKEKEKKEVLRSLLINIGLIEKIRFHALPLMLIKNFWVLWQFFFRFILKKNAIFECGLLKKRIYFVGLKKWLFNYFNWIFQLQTYFNNTDQIIVWEISYKIKLHTDIQFNFDLKYLLSTI